MNEFTTVTNDGVPTVHDSAADTGRPAGERAEEAEASVTGSDTHDTHQATHQARVLALLRGGPGAGKQVPVPRIAGTFPLFLGIDGGNYVRDKGSRDHPVYNWWPAGANSPAGDPNARSGTR